MADEDSFRILTYNAAGMKDEDLSDALELLWADMKDQWHIRGGAVDHSVRVFRDFHSGEGTFCFLNYFRCLASPSSKIK